MAKLTLNSAFEKLRGKVGNWVLRHWFGQPVAQQARELLSPRTDPAGTGQIGNSLCWPCYYHVRRRGVGLAENCP